MKAVIHFLLFLFFFSPLTSLAGITQWVDFKLENGHIKVPIKIEGIDTFAILDTGAQLNAINKAFVGKHNLTFTKGGKVRIDGIFGEKVFNKFNGISVSIFGVDMELDGAPPLSLGHHSTGLLLGSGFFSQFIVQIDYPNNRLRVMTRDVMNLSEFENIRAESQRGSGEPLVRVALGNDESFWALLDTGNNGGVIIERSYAESLGLIDKVTSSSMAMGATSMAVTESTRVPELVFGPYTLENVLVSFPAEGQSIVIEKQSSISGTLRKSQKQQGILGYDILKHFVLTMDYAKGQVHIGLPEEG